MRLLRTKSFWGGLAMVAAGGATAYYGKDYQTGAALALAGLQSVFLRHGMLKGAAADHNADLGKMVKAGLFRPDHSGEATELIETTPEQEHRRRHNDYARATEGTWDERAIRVQTIEEAGERNAERKRRGPR